MRVRTAGDVGALVRDARRRRGLTQDQLAGRAGVTRRWLSALESGKASVELGLVLATLDVLGVTLAAAESPPAPGGVATVGAVDLDEVLAELDGERG